MTLNEWLKAQRKKDPAYGQRQAARDFGISQTQVSRIAADESGASAITAARIIKGTKGKVRLHDLLPEAERLAIYGEKGRP